MIKICIAEDQEMLNTALTSILNLEDDLEVVGSALDGKTALQQITLHQPHLVILDIEMPEITGLEIAEELRKTHFSGKIIILTTFARQEYFERAVKAEVDGYLLKDNPTERLIQAIHNIFEGDTIYAAELVRHMLRSDLNPLTEREIDVLRKIAEGLTTQGIADNLFLASGTVRNYISSILSKTGAQSRIDAVNIAKGHGWLS
ncbi:response regulator transcription factor [Fundicoccus culcitae]|uniref:Response regulator transcription factor n=1 Tax=Fundicoccus culcitae TaxID=2969821 RepID=A0ABY5P5J1_9LACT|nr:response regulator transcription factor [Fundicoccus culcitae]UUX33880.1 response regulator transcription factor [Fundicoccus culcitae]